MKTKDFITKLFFYLGIDKDDIDINIKETENKISLNIQIPKDKAGFFIGNRGEALKAIQSYVRTVGKNFTDKKISIDINSYKLSKLDFLKKEIEKLAKKVLSLKKPLKVKGLNAYERFFVHSFIAENYPTLTTFSKNEGNKRVLIINIKAQNET